MLERILNVLTVGLHPPIPLELRSDYVQATPEKQAELRMKYAVRTLRWSRIMGAILGVLAIKGLWEFGLLAFLGLGSGTARATDLDKVRTEIVGVSAQTQALRNENASSRTESRREQLNSELRTNKGEEVALRTAIAEAHTRGERPLALLGTRLGELQARRDEVIRLLQALGPPPAP